MLSVRVSSSRGRKHQLGVPDHPALDRLLPCDPRSDWPVAWQHPALSHQPSGHWGGVPMGPRPGEGGSVWKGQHGASRAQGMGRAPPAPAQGSGRGCRAIRAKLLFGSMITVALAPVQGLGPGSKEVPGSMLRSPEPGWGGGRGMRGGECFQVWQREAVGVGPAGRQPLPSPLPLSPPHPARGTFQLLTWRGQRCWGRRALPGRN